MSDSNIFTFEGVETTHVFKFKSKKLGLDFTLVRRETKEVEVTVGLTLEEFKLLQASKSPLEVMLAKKIFPESKLVEPRDLNLL